MAEEAAQQPPLTINTQYVKDHSFENPNAPQIYGAMRNAKPDINVSIDLGIAGDANADINADIDFNFKKSSRAIWTSSLTSMQCQR